MPYTHSLKCKIHSFLVYSQNCGTMAQTDIWNIFHHPPNKPSFHQQLFPIHLHNQPSPRQLLICFLAVKIYLFWTFFVNIIIQYTVFHDRLLSLSIFSRFIHVIAYSRTLLFKAE